MSTALPLSDAAAAGDDGSLGVGGVIAFLILAFIFLGAVVGASAENSPLLRAVAAPQLRPRTTTPPGIDAPACTPSAALRAHVRPRRYARRHVTEVQPDLIVSSIVRLLVAHGYRGRLPVYDSTNTQLN